MSKRKHVVDAQGRHFRVRRGELVEIPLEWVGRTVGRQTINARPSKGLHKHRKLGKHPKVKRSAISKPGRLQRREDAE